MMPDYQASLEAEEDYFPWDCDLQYEDIENYDHDAWPTGLGED